MPRPSRGCDERAGNSSDRPSGAGASSRRKEHQPRAADQRETDGSDKAAFETQPTDPHAAIKAELWRWHLGRVFVHEFSKLARRVRPEPQPKKRRHTDDGGNGGARWQPTKPPEVGLAAFKHAQQQEQRAGAVRHFRAAQSTADTRRPSPEQDNGAPRGPTFDYGRSPQFARLRK